MADDIKAQLQRKRDEMAQLERQLEELERQRLDELYPGRCFQYCIDHGLHTQSELTRIDASVIQQRAEEHHFLRVAAGTGWKCGNSTCAGWFGTGDTCACGKKQFYWLYETHLPLGDSVITQTPGSNP